MISYDLSLSPNLEQVKRMLDRAFERFPIVNGLVFHSDQGWQYQHAYYRNRLSKHGIIQSMSRKGNCYDNSIMGTFFGSRKHFILFASYFFHHIKTPDSKGWNSGVVHTNGVEQNARWDRSASLVATEQSSCDI
ncbi:MAG: DDE-type integrase/transposase/recombinase [Clostridia bacterium]